MATRKSMIPQTLSRRQMVGGMLAAMAAVPAFSFGVSQAFAAGAAASSGKDGSAAAEGGVQDGVYTSSAQGMNDKVEVSVEFKGGKIASVNVTSSSETSGIGGQLKDLDEKVCTAGGTSAVDLIPQLIAENNSLAVDSVTGATITSAAILSAVEDCVKQAGGDPDAFKKAPVAYEDHKDCAADLVVVGGGGAGLVAAIAAAEQGKSVVIVEKNGECGGDTLVCGGIYNAPDPDMQSKVEMTDATKTTVEKALSMTSDDPDKQKALEEMQAPVQQQWDEYQQSGRTDLFDSKEWYALQTWINGDMVADPELVKVLTYNAYDGLTWVEGLGQKFADTIGQGAGSLWQRTHNPLLPMGTGLISTYYNQLEKHADLITVCTESTATELVVTDGRVTGVVAKNNHSGNEFTVTANEAVVLSTGGFSANSKMVQENNTSGKWPDLSSTMTTNRFTCSQGDGIGMATAAGASLTDMDQIQLLYLGNLKDGGLSKYPSRCLSGTDQIIFVNKNGERFVQEDGRRDDICLAILQQPDTMFYIIESGDGDGYKDIDDPDWRSADGFTFQHLEDNGSVYRGDTLEELAGKLNMDAATLQATVDKFNESVDSGSDDLGRTLFSTKLENGPWVATPRQACIHHTMGGVTIDTDCHVMGEDGAAVEGLYAAGEVTGGIHGANRLGGNAVVDTVVFGQLATDSIVADCA